MHGLFFIVPIIRHHAEFTDIGRDLVQYGGDGDSCSLEKTMQVGGLGCFKRQVWMSLVAEHTLGYRTQ